MEERGISHPRCPPFLPLSPPGQATCRHCQLSPAPNPLGKERDLWQGQQEVGNKREQKERTLFLKLPQAHESLWESHPTPCQDSLLHTDSHPDPSPSSIELLGLGSSIPTGGRDTRPKAQGLGRGDKVGSPLAGDHRLSRETHTHTYTYTQHAQIHALILNKIPFAYNLKINTQLILKKGSGWKEGRSGETLQPPHQALESPLALHSSLIGSLPFASAGLLPPFFPLRDHNQKVCLASKEGKGTAS